MKILFLGNSHTYYNDLPALFRHICAQCGRKVEVGMLAQPGVTYNWHLTNGTDFRFALMHGGYDYIVMQQAAHEPCPDGDETLAGALEIRDFAIKCGITPVQTIPWARLGIVGEQEKMYEVYNRVCAETGIKENPVGRIFEYINKNRPDIRLHWFDGAHASPYGSYANALCTYMTIFPGDDISNVGYTVYETNPGTQEAFDRLIVLEEQQRREPENAVLGAEVEELQAMFRTVCDKDKLKTTLDPEKAEYIKSAVKHILA